MAERLHTRECSKRMAEGDKLREAWRSTWLDACTQCYGAGELTNIGGRASHTETCSACLALSLCPRCGAGIRRGREMPECGACGWTLGSPSEPAVVLCCCTPQEALEDLLRIYTYASSDPTRTDGENAQMLQAREQLLAAGVDLGLPPVEREVPHG